MGVPAGIITVVCFICPTTIVDDVAPQVIDTIRPSTCARLSGVSRSSSSTSALLAPRLTLMLICCRSSTPLIVTRASWPLPEKASVRSPEGTFWSVKRPAPSIEAEIDVPTTVTLIELLAGRNDAAPNDPTTTPEMVALPLPAGTAVDAPGDADGLPGVVESDLPHAAADRTRATKTPITALLMLSSNPAASTQTSRSATPTPFRAATTPSKPHAARFDGSLDRRNERTSWKPAAHFPANCFAAFN